MATKTIKKNSKKTTDILKSKAKNLNKVALKTSHEIVDETLATGEQWQNLLAKTLKKGTVLFGKQQDMVLSGLEELKGQYRYGNKRFWKLLSFKPIDSKTPRMATRKPRAAAKTEKSIDQVMEAATKVEKTVKKAVKATTSKKAKPATAPKSRAVAPKKRTANSKRTKPSNLTLIEGIGPKIQQLLNKAGIKNFDQLAKAKVKDLRKILTDAGTRFQMHDPSTWAAQAKLAAAGKMDELKVLQKELKGGK